MPSQTETPIMTGTLDRVLVHYGEIALKGGNRRMFEQRLNGNIKSRLRGIPHAKVVNHYGRIVVEFPEPVAAKPVIEGLRQVFGIAYFCPMLKTGPSMEEISAGAVTLLRDESFKTFAVRARRVDRDYPVRSQDINCRLGGTVLENFDCKVNLDAPDLTLHVEVMHGEVFLYCRRVEGLRGLPVGCTGQVLSLVSGGIDSPVATLRMMKRGCRVTLLHFHSAPYTSIESQEKVEEFAEILTDYQRGVRLYLVALAPIQQAVVKHADSKYRILLYRRYMLRIAEAVAAKERCKALVTGEALAQVASQTIENLAAVAEVATLELFRPLLGMDKEEIITEAKRFGTFELSVDSGQDCCSFMNTRHPATKSRAADLKEQEAHLESAAGINALVQQAIDTAVVKEFD